MIAFDCRNFSYDDVHVKGAETIARVAKEQGIEKLIHLSALNASHPKPTIFNKVSNFVRTKVCTLYTLNSKCCTNLNKYLNL